MIKLILYFIFTFAFILFARFVAKKMNSRLFKIFVAIHTFLLLLSAVWHTWHYGQDKNYLYKAALDQEVYYYPQMAQYKYIQVLQDSSLCKLCSYELKLIALYHYNSLHYFIFYKILRTIFTGDFFFVGFFFASVLNAGLHIISLFLFVKTLDILQVTYRYKTFALLIFSQPFVIFRNAIPLSNSYTVFSLILFVYCLISKKHYIILYVLIFNLYLAHKIFYICVPVLFIVKLFIDFYKNNKFVLFAILCLVSSIMFFSYVNFSGIITHYCKYSEDSLIKSGSSFIPACRVIERIPNAWYCPLITNSSILFYKTEAGNKLGWLYAITINCVYLLLAIMVILRVKMLKTLTKSDKKNIFVLFVFIVMLSFAFCGIRNYLNLSRHNTNVISLWLVILAFFYKNKH